MSRHSTSNQRNSERSTGLLNCKQSCPGRQNSWQPAGVVTSARFEHHQPRPPREYSKLHLSIWLD